MKCPIIKENSVVEGDSAELLKCLESDSVDLIITSPPYWRDNRRKKYPEQHPDNWKEWWMPMASEMKRVLKDTGSLVMNVRPPAMGGTIHPFVMDTIRAMMDDGWQFRDQYTWVKTNPLPITPRYKLKDGTEPIFHFTKTSDFKFYPKRVMKDMDNCKTTKPQLYKKGDVYDRSRFHKSNCKKAYPSNVLTIAVGGGKSGHPARFPEQLPDFFIELMSDPGDVVLDPFAGGGTTNIVAVRKERKTIGFDIMPNFVDMGNKRLKEATELVS